MTNPKTIIISSILSVLFSLSLILWVNSGFPGILPIAQTDPNNIVASVCLSIFGGICGLALLVVFLAAYFLPSYIAFRRKVIHFRWIFMINLFFGAIFGLGWIGTFIWAVCGEPQKNNVLITQ